MYEETIEELEKLAKARGLRVEEGDGLNESVLYRDDEYLGSV